MEFNEEQERAAFDVWRKDKSFCLDWYGYSNGYDDWLARARIAHVREQVLEARVKELEAELSAVNIAWDKQVNDLVAEVATLREQIPKRHPDGKDHDPDAVPPNADRLREVQKSIVAALAKEPT